MARTPPNQSRAKLEDVAKTAGVSTATVSRALNKGTSVKRETRELIERVVEELNYTPSASARSLAGRRSYTIALFYDNLSATYLSKFQYGAIDQTGAHGYNLMISRCDNSSASAKDNILRVAEQNNLDGVILVPPLSDNTELVELLIEKNLNVALVAPIDRWASASSVSMDDENAAAELTEYLISFGHERIGFINGDKSHGAASLRLEGYKKALQKAGIAFDESLIVGYDITVSSGVEGGKELLNLPHPPTAIFGFNDEVAAGAVRAAALKGIRIPDDLSVVGFDDTDLAIALPTALTTIKQPIEDLARGAVDLLVQASETPKSKVIERRQYGYELISRESVGLKPT